MKNLFKRKTEIGYFYFVEAGERCGQFLSFLSFDYDVNAYCVLVLPDCEPIFVTEQEINKYKVDGLVKFIKKLPKKVIKDTFKEYEYRKNKSKSINTSKESYYGKI